MDGLQLLYVHILPVCPTGCQPHGAARRRTSMSVELPSGKPSGEQPITRLCLRISRFSPSVTLLVRSLVHASRGNRHRSRFLPGQLIFLRASLERNSSRSGSSASAGRPKVSRPPARVQAAFHHVAACALRLNHRPALRYIANVCGAAAVQRKGKIAPPWCRAPAAPVRSCCCPKVVL